MFRVVELNIFLRYIHFYKGSAKLNENNSLLSITYSWK